MMSGNNLFLATVAFIFELFSNLIYSDAYALEIPEGGDPDRS